MYSDVGDIVQYFPGGDVSSPWCAVVSALGNGTSRTLNIISPTMRNMEVFEGVLCHGDKAAKSFEITDKGSWKPNATQLALRELLIASNALVWNDDDRLVPKTEYVPKKKVEKTPDKPPVKNTTPPVPPLVPSA